jgi:hypothetical protein
MSKGSRLLKELMAMEPLTPEEAYGPRPKLRLRSELLTQTISPAAPVREVLDRLNSGETGEEVVLHDSKTGSVAVAIPVELYLYLATSHICAMNLSEVDADGGIRPPDATLAALGVEQENPQATWGGQTGDPNS